MKEDIVITGDALVKRCPTEVGRRGDFVDPDYGKMQVGPASVSLIAIIVIIQLPVQYLRSSVRGIRHISDMFLRYSRCFVRGNPPSTG